MTLVMKSTFKSFDRLKESGASEKLARSIVETIEESADFNLKDLATKADLIILRSDIKESESNLRSEMRTMQSDINWLKRLYLSGTLIIIIGLIANFLHH